MTHEKQMPAPHHIGYRQIVYRNPYQQVYRITAEFDGFTKEYFVTDTGPRAGVLVLKNDSVLMVRQYRLLIDRLSWEIPGGKVDDGETPEAAAVRECHEETGLLCRNLNPLVYFHPGLDTHHNLTNLFYTGNFVETPGEKPHIHEIHERDWIPLPRCIEMVFTQ